MLRTHVGSVKLKTPLLLASGHITETPDFFLKAPGCAGMVTRSLKEFPPPERARTPAPRYVVFGMNQSMLNCEWGNSVPWTEWQKHGVADVKKSGGAMIVSLSGREIESCIHLIHEFDKLQVDAFEINVSCAHSGALHGNLNTDFDHMKELLSKVRPETKTPIWIKLSYSPFLVEMAKLAEQLGADAIVCTNSIGPGMFIDTEAAIPKLGIKGGAGGVTGKAIFPIALNCVYQLAQAVKIPIVGSGGVFSADDVIQMMMAGASAVQLYTAPALKGPQVFHEINSDLRYFLSLHPYHNVEDLIGQALGKRDDHCFEAKIPKVIVGLCRGCKVCQSVCDFGAISFTEPMWNDEYYPHAVIDETKCVGCTACEHVCKTLAIEF